jgi:cellulose synthase/poly-beta-1,6-N-acetylglucosamine synthase-like glycosyltransferase
MLIACGAYIFLMLFYFAGWKRTKAWPIFASSNSTAITVIVPVRNEEKNVLRLLHFLAKQNYTTDKLEIIIVDDHSSDRTAELVLAHSFPNVRLIGLKSGKEGKKAAIAEGIKESSGTLIITTDADCEMSENWVSSIVSFYETHKPKMIVAPVLLKGEKDFSGIMQAQEMTVLNACACGALYYNTPILCSGANLAYEKEAFYAVSGFENAEQTLTGDDIFLLQKIHSHFPGQIKYLKSAHAVVYTHAETLYNAVKQRKRWASKTFLLGFSYTTIVAMLVFLVNFLIVLSIITTIAMWSINAKFALVIGTALLLKSIAEYMPLHAANAFFGKKNYSFFFLIAALFYPAYVVVMGIVSPFGKYSWKGRIS